MNGEMMLNDAGRMVWQWWDELNNKFPTIETDAAIVMPNHFHGIIAIVGVALCGRPDNVNRDKEGHPTLGDIMDWFKTMTTNGYITGVKQNDWPPFPGRLWQRNYYERVIRNDDELCDTREYIANNPATWAEDEENPAFTETTLAG